MREREKKGEIYGERGKGLKRGEGSEEEEEEEGAGRGEEWGGKGRIEVMESIAFYI